MKKFIILVLFCAVMFSGCSVGAPKNGEDGSDGKLNIVATLFPQYDFTREIVGDKANVTLLLPCGVDSHSFDPSISDVMKMDNADLLVYTGENMETWAKTFIDASDGNCRIVDVSKDISLIAPGDDGEDGHEDEKENHNADPHIWTSVENAEKIVRTICGAVCELDAENAQFYKENAEIYIDKLSSLDNDFKKCVENAVHKKIYVAGKFSLAYFVKEYGLSYLSLYDSCSESSEPSPKRLNLMINEINENNIKVVFYPELSDTKIADSICEKTSACAKVFHSCHNLSKKDFEDGETYLSLMQKNLENLEEALN